MPVLTASGVRKRFGEVVALAGAEFSLGAGEVHALIGANGCGKSTLCKVIAGATAADAGEIRIDGETVRFTGPQDAVARGIGVFYQELSLIARMSVAENIFLGREPLRRGFVDRPRLHAATAAALAGFSAAVAEAVDPEAQVADLTADQRQIVELLKVLPAEPRILILDEATAALDRDQVQTVFRRIRELKARGRSIIFISHRMDEVFDIADRITVMRNGVTVLSTRTAETTREAVVTAMVGATATARAAHARHRPGEEVALRAEGLAASRLAGVSFALHRGEILGFGGLHGQGQSELLRALFGMVPLRGGRVSVGGKPFQPRGPLAAMRRSLSYLSGDRTRNGVLAIRPIFENLVLSLLVRDRRPFVARARLERLVRPIVTALKLKFSSFDAPVTQLSGGNQQKVVIGRSLAIAPAIMLLDDPTKGIDMQAKEDLYATMDELCARGVAILLYSSDDMELLSVADRILVFNAGQVVAELTGENRTEYALYHAAYATGGALADA
jgi:ribose transport system ATP-binding protein